MSEVKSERGMEKVVKPEKCNMQTVQRNEKRSFAYRSLSGHC